MWEEEGTTSRKARRGGRRDVTKVGRKEPWECGRGRGTEGALLSVRDPAYLCLEEGTTVFGVRVWGKKEGRLVESGKEREATYAGEQGTTVAYRRPGLRGYGQLLQ